MPIVGLTKRGVDFPEIGQIRKGSEKRTRTNNKGEEYKIMGTDLEYFRVTFDEGEEESEAMFREVYGEEPKTIDVVFPFHEIDRQFMAWREAYTAGRMIARGDGEFYEYLVDTDNGEVLVRNGQNADGQRVPMPPSYIVGKDYKGKPVEAKPVARMKVVVPCLQRLAYLTLMTTSVHDIMNLDMQIEALKTVTGGNLAGIPLKLRRRPRMVSTPGKDGQRVRREKWLLSIEGDADWCRAQLGKMYAAALPSGLEKEAHLLPADIEAPDLETDVEDAEWEPETDEEETSSHRVAPGKRPYASANDLFYAIEYLADEKYTDIECPPSRRKITWDILTVILGEDPTNTLSLCWPGTEYSQHTLEGSRMNAIAELLEASKEDGAWIPSDRAMTEWKAAAKGVLPF